MIYLSVINLLVADFFNFFERLLLLKQKQRLWI